VQTAEIYLTRFISTQYVIVEDHVFPLLIITIPYYFKRLELVSPVSIKENLPFNINQGGVKVGSGVITEVLED